MRHPIPPLVVDLIERGATASPCIGGATQHSVSNQPLIHHAWPAYVLDFIERVRADVSFQAAALDEQYSGVGGRKFKGDRRTCRTAAYDAEIRLKGLIARDGTQISNRHRRPRVNRRAEHSAMAIDRILRQSIARYGAADEKT